MPPIEAITSLNAPDSKKTKHINKMLLWPTPDIKTSKFLLKALGFHKKAIKIAGRIATVGESDSLPFWHEPIPNITNIPKNNSKGNKLNSGV
jgi:hypothetical protein